VAISQGVKKVVAKTESLAFAKETELFYYVAQAKQIFGPRRGVHE